MRQALSFRLGVLKLSSPKAYCCQAYLLDSQTQGTYDGWRYHSCISPVAHVIIGEATMFDKILVCLDGSRLAEQIIPYAAEQALRFNSRLVLFQVVPEPIVVGPAIPGAAPPPVVTDAMIQRAQEAVAEARSYLEEVAKPLRQRRIRVDVVATPGTASQAIKMFADTNNIDLIAIATHGRSGLGRAVFGSVADSVLRESGLPILVIKPRDQRDSDQPKEGTIAG